LVLNLENFDYPVADSEILKRGKGDLEREGGLSLKNRKKSILGLNFIVLLHANVWEKRGRGPLNLPLLSVDDKTPSPL
jgi:hypothetical protein